MGFVVLLAVSAVLFGLAAALAVVWDWSTGSPRHDEVLPAHYSSLLQFDRTRYPGHCPECGTDNEPGYRYCEQCGGAIPTTDGPPGDADVAWIIEG